MRRFLTTNEHPVARLVRALAGLGLVGFAVAGGRPARATLASCRC